MSIHIDDLRDAAANKGIGVCDLAADEIEDLEKAYALLFAENAKLRAALESVRITGPGKEDGDYWVHFAAEGGRIGGFNLGKAGGTAVGAAIDWQAQRDQTRAPS